MSFACKSFDTDSYAKFDALTKDIDGYVLRNQANLKELENLLRNYAEFLKKIDDLQPVVQHKTHIRPGINASKVEHRPPPYMRRRIRFRTYEDHISFDNCKSTRPRYDQMVALTESGIICLSSVETNTTDFFKIFQGRDKLWKSRFLF
jgi:hypothetical protein